MLISFLYDLEVTPNRPDLNSVVGIAREISALTGSPLKLPKLPVVSGSLSTVGTDAHTLVDARLTWESADRGWAMSLFGTNLTDEVYFHGMLSLVTVLGREQGNVARPSEWGLALKRSF